MKSEDKKVRFIDLFAGAGGLSEGFIRAGFEPIAHIEMNTFACETLKTRMAYHHLAKNNQSGIYTDYLKGIVNRDAFWASVPDKVIKSVINREISEESIDELFKLTDQLKEDQSVDLIVGGPPCQAYSIVGRARDPQNMQSDPRNFLYKYYLRFIDRYKPKMFVFENVPGILSAKNGDHLKDIIIGIKEIGYEVEFRTLLASEYGVLQNRSRVIIVGWHRGSNLHYPNIQKEENPFKILSDLFSDLPIRNHGEGELTTPVRYTQPINEYLKYSKIRNGLDFTTQHIARPHNPTDLEIYRQAIEQWISKRQRLDYSKLAPELQNHKNTDSFLNRFQVVDPMGFCHTVVAHIAMDGHYYIYPSLEQIRSITIREAARIQSFPDDYFFEGSRTAAFKQIGNAVPVLLAEKIAMKIKEQF
ncbi:MAG: DNA cytosine methyltransferase [Paludibacter sp.]|nr:DNA cytosine methyltransferase [Paludibacter sp.]